MAAEKYGYKKECLHCVHLKGCTVMKFKPEKCIRFEERKKEKEDGIH